MKTTRNLRGVPRLLAGPFSFGVALLLGGCQHRQAPPLLPAIIQPPALQPPLPPSPFMSAPLPEEIASAPDIHVVEIRPRRYVRRSRSSGVETDEPAAPAAADPGAAPEGVDIGELSAGGDSNPQTRQEALGLITTSEQRLGGLKRGNTQQQSQVRKVRYFLHQARQALSTGDAEGAKTLAMKAKLLLDDLQSSKL